MMGLNNMLETYIDLHFPVESIVQEEVVCHPDTVRFHGMSLSVIIITNVTCKDNMTKSTFQLELYV